MSDITVTVLVDYACEDGIDWNEPKETLPRIKVLGFTDGKRDNVFPSSLFDEYISCRRKIEVKIKDYDDYFYVPNSLFVIIGVDRVCRTFGRYSNMSYPAGNWYVHKAFISLEKAKNYIQGKDTESSRYWLIQIVYLGEKPTPLMDDRKSHTLFEKNNHHVLIIQDADNDLHAVLSIANDLEEERKNWNPKERIVASFPLNDKLQAIGILANTNDADKTDSLNYQLEELLINVANFGRSLNSV